MTEEDSARSHGAAIEWLIPLAFLIPAAWVTWRVPGFIMALGGGTDSMQRRFAEAGVVDWVALALLPVIFILGVRGVRRAGMEYDDVGALDKVSVFIGRATMLLVVVLVAVMSYEVFMRYVAVAPTVWATELSLWIAGFIFLFSGLYAMQQRSHIRIFLLYDLMPRWLQKSCDTLSAALIVLFAVALIYGGYGEAHDKFLRWETFGTAFDPPIPATLKPMVLVIVSLVAVQAVWNLIRDWHRAPEHHTAADEIDQDEIEKLKKILGPTDDV
ncbi:TRAP transporter small permease subunit [Oceanibium sediminis]|uniref:TRAP transporter small permease subunit n=1 Tax=Oceanibium sediminis TaxID=2026339 RepID=UPI000DD357B7|nr:TRAP transporter small permease [Oceanibium sediminis]